MFYSELLCHSRVWSWAGNLLELILTFNYVGAGNWVQIAKQVPLSVVPSHQSDQRLILEIVCK